MNIELRGSFVLDVPAAAQCMGSTWLTYRVFPSERHYRCFGAIEVNKTLRIWSVVAMMSSFVALTPFHVFVYPSMSHTQSSINPLWAKISICFFLLVATCLCRFWLFVLQAQHPNQTQTERNDRKLILLFNPQFYELQCQREITWVSGYRGFHFVTLASGEWNSSCTRFTN